MSKPTEFANVTAREFSDVVANPDNHEGKALVIYGKVTQFDSRTGPRSLRADTGGELVQASRASSYVSYPHNSMLSGSESVLQGLAEDDIFEAQV
ncbi:MAG: hypothetical protein Q4G46_13390, partial [Propionibacteriaceae bacterium]|nr:hypothetical protein [Propionibacteriaceae bacterium]